MNKKDIFSRESDSRKGTLRPLCAPIKKKKKKKKKKKRGGGGRVSEKN